MKREDYNLPFMLRYENVAWYEDGKVRILDRRIYPTEVRFVTCTTYQEVAQAITDMVTQSAGPYTAAGMGMALAAYQVRDESVVKQRIFLKEAAATIGHARPTTANRMLQITHHALQAAELAFERGTSAEEAIFNETLKSLNRRYATMSRVGGYLLTKINANDHVLTQCFGETIVGMMLRGAIEQQKVFKLYTAETRPYLQGARLTASCGVDMGFDTTVITDNMVGYVMEYEGIDLFTSAADTIALDGYIANKIGTKQIALLAQHYDVPYYVTGIPDEHKKSHHDIVIEMRDPQQVLTFQGIPHTLNGAKALYPSFDITSPNLIAGIVTDKGIYQATEVATYFDTAVQQFY